ncbi:MAG TPA: hypothetical protein VHU61_12695 [Solirubrobacteraceae bacterium]|jgi:hypothetical protein|nr:hypothetical protein [Solirubrobacteraceae bacterium]
MDDARLALTLARGRIAFGAAAVVAPGLTVRLLGGRKASGVEPLLARMVGARDLTLGLGAVIALDRGAPVRGWIEGAAVADAVDAVAGLLAKKRMRPHAFTATIVLAAGSATLGAYLSRRLDPPPPAHPHQPEAAITGHPEPAGP